MSTHTPTLLDQFTARNTPANAIRLAISDHKALNKFVDGDFLRQLHKAIDQCEQHEALVAIAQKLVDHATELKHIYGDQAPMSAGIVSLAIEARAALAAAKGGE